MKKLTLILALLYQICFSNEWLLDFGIGITDYTRTVTTIRDDKIEISMGGAGIWMAPVIFSDGIDFAFKIGLYTSEGDKSKIIDEYYQEEGAIYTTRVTNDSLYLSPRLSLLLSSSDPTFRWYLLSGYVHEGIRYNVRGRIDEEKVDLVKFDEINQSMELLSCVVLITDPEQRVMELGVQGGPKYNFTTERFSLPLKLSLSLMGVSLTVETELFTGNDNISFSAGVFALIDND